MALAESDSAFRLNPAGRDANMFTRGWDEGDALGKRNQRIIIIYALTTEKITEPGTTSKAVACRGSAHSTCGKSWPCITCYKETGTLVTGRKMGTRGERTLWKI